MRKRGAEENLVAKRKPKPDDAKQYARFVETAHKLEIGESGEEFLRAFNVITRSAAKPTSGGSKLRKKRGK